jgi:hypothetical protein
MSASLPTAELAQAERLLLEPRTARHQSLRMACWLLRSVLEQTVRDLLDARGADVGHASGRVTLICLSALYADTSPDLAYDAEKTWARLSHAVHHHAYELSPTLTEVQDLAGTVADIVRFSAHCGG